MAAALSLLLLLPLQTIADLQSSREREASQPRTPPLLLPELLRNALARRPGEPRTVLQELQSAWRRSRLGSFGKRSSGSDDLRVQGRGDREP